MFRIRDYGVGLERCLWCDAEQANRSIPRGNKRRLTFVLRTQKTARNERFFCFLHEEKLLLLIPTGCPQ